MARESAGFPPSGLRVAVIMSSNRVVLVCSRFTQAVLCVSKRFLKHTESNVAVWKIINVGEVEPQA